MKVNSVGFINPSLVVKPDSHSRWGLHKIKLCHLIREDNWTIGLKECLCTLVKGKNDLSNIFCQERISPSHSEQALFR